MLFFLLYHYFFLMYFNFTKFYLYSLKSRKIHFLRYSLLVSTLFTKVYSSSEYQLPFLLFHVLFLGFLKNLFAYSYIALRFQALHSFCEFYNSGRASFEVIIVNENILMVYQRKSLCLESGIALIFLPETHVVTSGKLLNFCCSPSLFLGLLLTNIVYY